jgi:hypothetical protein
VVVAGVPVQLEELSDAEDARRRTAFLNWLFDCEGRPEFKVFASTLMESPEKIAVLVRVPGALMKGKVLPSADAVPQMEAICAQVYESDSASTSSMQPAVSASRMQPAASGSGQQPVGGGSSDGAGGGSSGSNGIGGKKSLGQILLEEHAAEFEAALPAGFLPINWRKYTFRELLDKTRWAVLNVFLFVAVVSAACKSDPKAHHLSSRQLTPLLEVAG